MLSSALSNNFLETHDIDEDRLGQAFCKFMVWEWDDYVGEKPEGFDDLEEYIAPKWYHILLGLKSRKISKYTYIMPILRNIENTLGAGKCNWYWWKYHLKRPYEEWLIWHFTEPYMPMYTFK